MSTALRSNPSLERNRDLSKRLVPWLLLTPAAVLATIGFIVPIVWLIGISIANVSASGALTNGWTTHNYTAFLSEPFNVWIILRTVLLGAIVTFLSLIAAYPIALYIFRLQSKWKPVLLILMISPMLVSSVVRTFGWIIILGDRGLVNSLLGWIGLISSSLKLANNFTGTVIALTEILMPYMALSLISGFGRLDVRQEEAAATLGASGIKRFWLVTLPLSLPGIILGCLICFALAMSSFVTPQLLGGGRVFVLATEIYDSATVSLNWPLAAVQSVTLLTLLLLAMVAFNRLGKSVDVV